MAGDIIETPMNLPNRIREVRVEKGLTLEQLSDKVGLSFGQVAKMERGDRGLNLEWLQRFARALDCRAADLLPPEAKDPFIDSDTDKTELGFGLAESVSLFEEHWPVRIRGEDSGFNPHGCLYFGLTFLERFDIDPKLCEVVEVRSRSMEPTVPYGSVCLVDGRKRRKSLVEDALYAVTLGGQLLIRRAAVDQSRWVLVAEDASEPIDPKTEVDFEMVGRVIWMARMLVAEPAPPSSAAAAA